MRILRVAALVTIAACKTAETPVPVAAAAPEPKPVVAAAVQLAPAKPLPALPLGATPVTASPENPVTAEKAELGWFLFFDKRLSKDGSMSCAQCHHTDKAYTSGAALDAKVGGAMNKRNAPTMVGLGLHTSWYWDGRKASLEAVSAAAWTGQLGADAAVVVKALNEHPTYRALFERAFGGPATVDTVPQALATFFRTLNTGNSPWDRAAAGDDKALSSDAKVGQALFLSAGCASCHVPPLFSNYGFHALGLGDDPGRRDATNDEKDRGAFKTPSLRNVALTAPYFHDGHAKTLEDAIAVMARGGNGSKDPLLKPVSWKPAQVAQVKAFLESLTGTLTWPDAPTLP